MMRGSVGEETLTFCYRRRISMASTRSSDMLRRVWMWWTGSVASGLEPEIVPCRRSGLRAVT